VKVCVVGGGWCGLGCLELVRGGGDGVWEKESGVEGEEGGGGGGGGRVLRNNFTIVLQSCGQCRWAAQYQDGRLVQESFGVNEYLVKADA